MLLLPCRLSIDLNAPSGRCIAAPPSTVFLLFLMVFFCGAASPAPLTIAATPCTLIALAGSLWARRMLWPASQQAGQWHAGGSAARPRPRRRSWRAGSGQAAAPELSQLRGMQPAANAAKCQKQSPGWQLREQQRPGVRYCGNRRPGNSQVMQVDFGSKVLCRIVSS